MKKLLIIFIIPVFLFSCQRKDPKEVLKLAHGLDPSHPVHQAMVFMANRCNEISDGKPSISYFYDYDGRTIWGATARIIKQFMDILRTVKVA